MDYEYWLRLARGGASFFYEQKRWPGLGSIPRPRRSARESKCMPRSTIMLRAKLGVTPLAWILAYSHVVADDKFGIPAPSIGGTYRQLF